MERTYTIAISFAEEDRNAALALALALELKGVKDVYYYPDRRGDTAGKPLLKELREIYSTRARYTVILLSKKYFKKPTALGELKVLYKRVLKEPGINSVIPVLLETKVGLSKYPALEKLAYLEWKFDPKKVVDVLIQQLGKQRLDPGDILAKKIEPLINVVQENTAEEVENQSNTLSIKF